MFKTEERNSLRADQRTRCRSGVSQMRGIGLLYVDCPAHWATPDDGSYKSVPTPSGSTPALRGRRPWVPQRWTRLRATGPECGMKGYRSVSP